MANVDYNAYKSVIQDAEVECKSLCDMFEKGHVEHRTKEDLVRKLQEQYSVIGIKLNQIYKEMDIAPLGVATPTASGKIQDFFQKVGSATIRAQEQLDYQAHILNPMEPGRTFVIPRVKAEFKFAVENLSSEDVDVLVFSRDNEQKELNQQTISFEIAAMPPTVEEAEKSMLHHYLKLVLDDAERKRAIAVASSDTDLLSDDIKSNQILIFSFNADPEKPQFKKYLLINEIGNGGIVYKENNDYVYRGVNLRANNTDDSLLLYDMLRGYTDMQANFMNKRRNA